MYIMGESNCVKSGGPLNTVNIVKGILVNSLSNIVNSIIGVLLNLSQV